MKRGRLPIMSIVAHSKRFSMLYGAPGSLPSNLTASLAALVAASAKAALHVGKFQILMLKKPRQGMMSFWPFQTFLLLPPHRAASL